MPHSLQSLHNIAMQLYKERTFASSLFVSLLGRGRQPCCFDFLQVQLTVRSQCLDILWYNMQLQLLRCSLAYTINGAVFTWYVHYRWDKERHE